MGQTAIVIGGGIGGPLAAVALERGGVSATVYEAYPEHAGLGAGLWLTVAVNGIAALRTLGADAPVMRVGFPSETIEFASGTGKPLGRVPIGGRLEDGCLTHTLKRADLLVALQRVAVSAGVRTLYEKRLVEAVEEGERVVARFDDGSEARADILIGADGVHSQVRRSIDAQAPSPTYNGLHNTGGFAPAGTLDLAPGKYHMVFGTRAFFGYTAAPSGEVWWFANTPCAREQSRSELASRDWRAYLLDAFAGDRGPMVELIQRTPGPLVGTNQYELPTVPRWHAGRMLILGDAAHAASPSSGQGASMAVEDAVALGVSVRAHGANPAALEQFVAARRARCERIVAHGRRNSNLKTLGPIGRAFRDWMLPLVFRRQVRSASSKSRAWLFDHRIEGQLVNCAMTSPRQ